MKALRDETLDIIEEAAREGGKEILAFFRSQRGANDFGAARIGAAAINGLGKLRASEANRLLLECKYKTGADGKEA